MPSGKETYAILSPSFEVVTPSAESPERYGANCRVFGSYRINSPRGLAPMKKTFVPSLLGNGASALICPTVNCTGSRLIFCHTPAFSRMAHKFATPKRVDWKTKYFPSLVQFPQHSLVGLFQPASNCLRWLPSGCASHKELVTSLALKTLNRRTRPSHENRGQNAWPSVVRSFRTRLPPPLPVTTHRP